CRFLPGSAVQKPGSHSPIAPPQGRFSVSYFFTIHVVLGALPVFIPAMQKSEEKGYLPTRQVA
ncbi:hypothetical protein ABIE02_003780, partial [Leclercia sp. 1548]|uniref:hypothetical protein n=1 Tax=Leclercia sp. 1548 TaxID=3156446 RepID=UPI003D1E92A5